jgi:purine-binding chemotaxis protein CheW
MTTTATAAAATQQLVTFSLDAEEYGISITRVQEIIRHTPSRPVPGRPAELEGVIDLRGRIIPVMDLRARLGVGGDAPENAKVVITEIDDRTVGIVVDDVREVITIDLACTEPPPAYTLGGDGDAIESVAKVGDRLLVVLDAVRLLAQ